MDFSETITYAIVKICEQKVDKARGGVASCTVMLRPNVIEIDIAHFRPQKVRYFVPIVVAIDCIALACLISEEKESNRSKINTT